MKFVEEIVVEEFLPTIRSMLAEALRNRGLTQHEVAEALGISQSAVSKYAHGDVERHDRIVEDERVRELTERIADGLASGDMSRVSALVEIEILIRQLEDGDLLSDLHEEAMSELADVEADFSVHDPDSHVRASEQVLSSVNRGLRTLTNASGFAALIPAVGSNLVECLPGAATIEDVAGVPGRIFDVKGRATIPADPEFGVSGHVATVLLAVRGVGFDAVRGAVNLRYEPALVDAMASAGYETIEFDPAGENDRGRTIEETLSDRDIDAPFVLYQTGDVGIEPIVYVLAADAPTAAEIAREFA